MNTSRAARIDVASVTEIQSNTDKVLSSRTSKKRDAMASRFGPLAFVASMQATYSGRFASGCDIIDSTQDAARMRHTLRENRRTQKLASTRAKPTNAVCGPSFSIRQIELVSTRRSREENGNPNAGGLGEWQ